MYVEAIKKTGYKLTKPRKLILDLLKDIHEPMSTQEIHKRLADGVDLVSVYRTLRLFEELGFLHREESDGNIRYYISPRPHHHIVCKECRYVKCMPCRHDFSKIKGFNSVKHQLTLTGVCSKCSK